MRDARGRSFRVHRNVKLRRGEQRAFPRSLGAFCQSLAFYFAALVVFLAMALAPMPREIGWGLVAVLLVLGLAVIGALLACGSWIANREAYERAARSMRHGSNCPQCWYDLAGHEHEADGCVVCPECGAAWRVAADGPSS